MKECRRIATSLVYLLFVGVLVIGWIQNFQGGTKAEIDWANGKPPAGMTFERPLLLEPSKEDDYFGSKTSEEYPEKIMVGVTRKLLMEYENNIYETYPLGNYKAVTLGSKEQSRVLEILCEITGLTKEQLEKLPQDYFPAVTGTIFSTDRMETDENGNVIVQSGNDNKSSENSNEKDKTKKFVSQVSYEHFNELMKEMENIIGEKGSSYSKEMMITYFGLSEMNYEEAYADYQQTIQKDKLTGGFARLFCDYLGLSLGLYPIFIIVIMWIRDSMSNVTELINVRKVSSIKLVFSRYLATITMVLIPVILLSFESLMPLISFGNQEGILIDYFAYIKYIFWWLLPTVMMVSAIGTFFTLLTDSPVAIAIQFLWWMIDKGVTGLSGDTKITTLMIRHNTLRGYEIIQKGFEDICMNRILIAGTSILLVLLSVWILSQKRKGKINAASFYNKSFMYIKNKFSFSYTK